MTFRRPQVCTQRASSRPYGVGLLIAGHDQTGAHIFYNCPSGNYYEYKAMTIGARSQAAKTYLERHYETFEVCPPSPSPKVQHGSSALACILPRHSLKALTRRTIYTTRC